MELSSRVAAITGAGRGIGRALALALAREGAKVAVLARTLPEVEGVAEELRAAGAVARAYRCDVADAASVSEAFAALSRDLGPVDILAANAGIAPSVPFGKTDLALWQRTLDVNLTGAFLCAREVFQGMTARRFGRILFIASTAAKKGYTYTSAYCASKHGVLGLTRALALELAETGVTVNAICPGFVDTPMTEQTIRTISQKTGRSPEEARRALEILSPQKRLFTAEEVAFVATSLCREGARGITGQGIVIAGGEVMS
jgi:NAD(P)-dependent dehydrogenase (short-subunit alcohol dehydrogenase family)